MIIASLVGPPAERTALAAAAPAVKKCEGFGAGGNYPAVHGHDPLLDGEGWGIQFTKVKGTSCKKAERLVKKVCTRGGVPSGWKAAVKGSRIVFKSKKIRIEGMPVGGGPVCMGSWLIIAPKAESDPRHASTAFGENYRPATASEIKLMSKAADKDHPDLPGVGNQFAWMIGTIDSTVGYVCGDRKGSTGGVTLVLRDGKWQWPDVLSSGTLQQADFSCAGG